MSALITSETILTNKIHNLGLFWKFNRFRDQNDYYPF